MVSLLKKKKIELIGLDVGSYAVKLVQLAKSAQGYNLNCAAIAEIQHNEENTSDLSSETRTAAAIKKCVQGGPVKTKYATCGLGGSEVTVRGFKFPQMPSKSLDQAVFLEAQSVCPLDIRSCVLDYQLVGQKPSSTKDELTEANPQSGLMAAASEHLVKERTNDLVSAGLKPVLMDVEAMAILNCLNELNLIKEFGAVAAIDIGHSKTSIIIYGQNGLPFVRDLNIAGSTILRQIAQELQIDEKLVRSTLCLKQKDETTIEQRNRVLLALNNAIRPLVSMINDTLRFYSFQEKTAAIEKIFLCGGFSLIGMFTEMLTDALPVETVLLNPFSYMDCGSLQDKDKWIDCGPAMVVATGLAMRTL